MVSGALTFQNLPRQLITLDTFYLSSGGVCCVALVTKASQCAIVNFQYDISTLLHRCKKKFDISWFFGIPLCNRGLFVS